MKVVILAGGLGSRLNEETVNKPKALVEIGGYPILWHIMNYYSAFCFKDFIIALGYKGECIRQWLDSFLESTISAKYSIDNKKIINKNKFFPWSINLVDTGQDTQTGGRIKRLASLIGDESFLLTWCDGLADVDLFELVKFHRSHGRLATLTAVHPPPRFGHIELNGNKVTKFKEKPEDYKTWVNGAFFVLEPEVINYITNDKTQFEKDPLERLAAEGQLMAYRHKGFWQCMDTIHEKNLLDNLWRSAQAPWKKW